MIFLTLKELSGRDFNIHSPNIRNPVYMEGSTYYISDMVEHRNSTGIVYLKDCDMTTTSLYTNIQYKFKKGALVLLPENSKYFSTFTNISNSIPTFYCLNSCLYSHNFKKIIVEKEPLLIFEKTPEDIINHIEQNPPINCSPAFISSYFFTFWDLIFKNMHLSASINVSLQNILNNSTLSNKTNTNLVKELNVSVSTLTRMFKKHFNTTPAAYALRLKIINAQFQLENTDISVGEIARNLGFNSPEHFSRIFKKYAGLSPMKYRNRHS